MNSQNKRIEKQDERIEQISQKLESWFDDPGEEYDDYQYDCEYSVHDDESEISCNQPDKDASSEPAPKKQKTSENSIFKSLGEKFLQVETVDNEVNDDLANFVNTAFRSGISEEKQVDLIKEIHRSSNCESLVKTRVNQGIWRLLKSNTRTDDAKLQSIQTYLVKASTNVTKLLDKHGESFDSQDVE